MFAVGIAADGRFPPVCQPAQGVNGGWDLSFFVLRSDMNTITALPGDRAPYAYVSGGVCKWSLSRWVYGAGAVFTAVACAGAWKLSGYAMLPKHVHNCCVIQQRFPRLP